MDDLERGGRRGFAEVPRFASLVLLEGVEQRRHVHIVVVVKVAPPLLVRPQEVLKLLQEKLWKTLNMRQKPQILRKIKG